MTVFGLSRSRWAAATAATAVVVLAWAGLSAAATIGDDLRVHYQLMAFFALVIGAGELARVQMPSGRVAAPVASASAIALAEVVTVDGQPTFDVSASVVVLTAAAGMGLGAVLRGVLGLRVGPHLMAARLVGLAVVAVIARRDGDPDGLLAHVQNPVDDRLLALALLLAAVAGILVEYLLTGLIRAERNRTPWAAALRDELGEAPALTLGVATTGPLVALLARVLGLAALPLALVPVIVTYVAVRRYAANRLTFRETLLTLSQLTEAAGYTPPEHARRVAELSVRLARALGLVEREVLDVEYAALLHDLGQVGLRTPIPGGATVLAAPDDQRHIAAEGARIVRRTNVLDVAAGYVETQATAYHRMREYDEEVPLASRIIKVANAYDDLTAGAEDPAASSSALERIHLGLGYEYDPLVVDALVALVGAAPVARVRSKASAGPETAEPPRRSR